MNKNLNQILINYGAKKCAIRDIEKSCCNNIKLEVFDYDDLVKKFCENNKIKSKSSVDALYFDDTKMYFIEMKGFENFKKYNKKLSVEKIENRINKWDFGKKLTESYNVLQDISNNTISEFYIKYIILTDLSDNPLLNFATMAKYLSNTSNEDDKICEILKNRLNCINTNNIINEKPILKFCYNFEKFISDN